MCTQSELPDLSRIKIKTNEYEHSYGHKPQGWNEWAFEISGDVYFYTASFKRASDFARRLAASRGAEFVNVIPN